MIKFYLPDNLIIIDVVVAKEGKDRIEIDNGIYKKKKYDTLMYNNGTLILSGSGSDAYSKADCFLVEITIESIKEKIARTLNNKDVCIVGINAISDGEERKILEKLLF